MVKEIQNLSSSKGKGKLKFKNLREMNLYEHDKK
mgnify:CR=1 FL=1